MKRKRRRPARWLWRAGRTAASGAALVGAAVTIRAWNRRFDYTTGEDERLFAATADGWRIALARYRPRGTPHRYPVVCGHGFAGSRLIFDLGSEASLARFLAAAGFDVYTVDLRGRGESWPLRGPGDLPHWNFDEIAGEDLPAAVETACRAAGAPSAFWVGHEMSGQALYAAAILGRAQRVRGAVTIGAPAVTPPDARVPGVTAAPRTRWRGRVPFRAGARAAGGLLAASRSAALEASFRPVNTDPVVAGRYLRNGVPDESSVLADQFVSWIREGTMRSLDGVRYADRLGDVTVPILAIAGARDLQRPPEAVRTTVEALGSEDKTFLLAGKTEGFSTDYGHDDLLGGRAAPEEIFPRIRDWLDERSGP